MDANGVSKRDLFIAKVNHFGAVVVNYRLSIPAKMLEKFNKLV